VFILRQAAQQRTAARRRANGQSEIGFGITRLLGFDLLPRIKLQNCYGAWTSGSRAYPVPKDAGGHRNLPAELARVTRAGGAVLAAVFSNASRSRARDRIDALAQEAGWQVPDWYLDLKTSAVPILGTADAMRAAASAARLAGILVQERPVDVGITKPGQLVSYRLGQPLFAAWLDRIGPRRAAEFASHATGAIGLIMQPYQPIVVFLAATTPV